MVKREMTEEIKAVQGEVTEEMKVQGRTKQGRAELVGAHAQYTYRTVNREQRSSLENRRYENLRTITNIIYY